MPRANKFLLSLFLSLSPLARDTKLRRKVRRKAEPRITHGKRIGREKEQRGGWRRGTTEQSTLRTL